MFVVLPEYLNTRTGTVCIYFEFCLLSRLSIGIQNISRSLINVQEESKYHDAMMPWFAMVEGSCDKDVPCEFQNKVRHIKNDSVD